MPGEPKLEYNQLETGYDFPPSSYQLDSAVVVAYLEAVGETSRLYRDSGLVPPLAVAARAMAALSDGMRLPPGTIHVSQELEFLSAVNVKDTLTSRARVSRKQSRGKFHMLNIDLNVFNQKQQAVLSGKTSFILPEPDDGW
ncbi:MAG: MaoC family dehydratase N-terminal domain-containing protein [Chloroflexi bacterium]|nr:MaoC family dehydratase N-terminal domain-containing protein [Chloroflexota bacterium]